MDSPFAEREPGEEYIVRGRDLPESPVLHPVLNQFPTIRRTVYDDIRASILRFGQIEPIVTYQGVLLDGVLRYRAIRDLGFNLRCREFDPETQGGDPAIYIIGVNLFRRHLGDIDRGVLKSSCESIINTLERKTKPAPKMSLSHPITRSKGSPDTTQDLLNAVLQLSSGDQKRILAALISHALPLMGVV